MSYIEIYINKLMADHLHTKKLARHRLSVSEILHRTQVNTMNRLIFISISILFLYSKNMIKNLHLDIIIRWSIIAPPNVITIFYDVFFGAISIVFSKLKLNNTINFSINNPSFYDIHENDRSDHNKCCDHYLGKTACQIAYYFSIMK